MADITNCKWVFMMHNFKNTESWEDKASKWQHIKVKQYQAGVAPTFLILQLLWEPL